MAAQAMEITEHAIFALCSICTLLCARPVDLRGKLVFGL